ncbi:HAMP domain-containing sensor histidine kinase [Desulfotomaculum sp. 1211_IL3151]|uniref:HAMP domain-containing sensor histidine kinase n=1 Tax=Desulfotomaculum sp. 1211_IL3151 TaxID=3084055 RepID=UPI002FDA918D
MSKPHTSLRLKLLATFAICLFLSFVFFYILDYITRDLRAEYYPSYVSSKAVVNGQAELIQKRLPYLNEHQKIALFLEEVGDREPRLRIYLTDVHGKVLYHSTGTSESTLNIHRILYTTQKSLQEPAPGKPYAVVKPVILNGLDSFLVVAGTLYAEPGVNYKFNPLLNSTIFVAIFLLLFYWFTRNKIRQIQAINNSLQEVANGNLQVRLPLSSQDELGNLSHNINFMAQQLQEKIAREKAVEKSKLDLITNISHDLRTPLTSIIGYLTLLKEKNYQDSGELEHFIASGHNKANQLKKLIDDLFEYTRLSDGNINLDKQSIDLREMLEQMVVEFEPLADQQGILIQCEIGKDPVQAAVDPDKLARTLDNLLINALKFSVKPGAIRITLKTDGKWVFIAVANKGLAMTKEQEDEVFERFFNINSTLDSGAMPSSTGLGLSIAKNIVELHNGKIWLARKDNYYEFIIKLPL